MMMSEGSIVQSNDELQDIFVLFWKILFSTELNTSVFNNDFKPFSFDFYLDAPEHFYHTLEPPCLVPIKVLHSLVGHIVHYVVHI